MAMGITGPYQRVVALRDSQLLRLDLTPGQERRAGYCTAVRAVAVERDYELVRDFVGDGLARAPSSEHSGSLGVDGLTLAWAVFRNDL
jgi:hypothetical protein